MSKEMQSGDVRAVAAFEKSVREDPVRGLMADHILKKLESYDQSNPEYLDRIIDAEWQVFLRGWQAFANNLMELDQIKEAGLDRDIDELQGKISEKVDLLLGSDQLTQIFPEHMFTLSSGTGNLSRTQTINSVAYAALEFRARIFASMSIVRVKPKQSKAEQITDLKSEFDDRNKQLRELNILLGQFVNYSPVLCDGTECTTTANDIKAASKSASEYQNKILEALDR